MLFWRKFAEKWGQHAPSTAAVDEASSVMADMPCIEINQPAGVEPVSEIPTMAKAEEESNNAHYAPIGSEDLERAEWRDPLELGENPHDPLIVDLVTRNETSVRLRNAVVAGHDSGALPLRRLSDYLAAGVTAPEVMMRHVANLGRKSAAELDELVQLASADQSVALAAPDEHQLRIALAGLFKAVTVEEVIAAGQAPARLIHGLSQLDLANAPFETLILRFHEVWAALVKLPNMGRTTAAAGSVIVTNTLQREFARRGLSVEQAADAEAILLTGATLAAFKRKALGDALSGHPTEDMGGPSVVVAATMDDPEPVQHPSEIVALVLADLNPRQQDVVRRRFGMIGRPETLEELGQAYGVTRERIRQIEAKAIRLMKQRVRRRMSRALIQHGADLWALVAGAGWFVPEGDLSRARRATGGALGLAIELSDFTFEEWLSAFAQPCEGGWVAPDADLTVLEAVRGRLEDGLTWAQLPCALTAILPPEDLDYAPAAVALGRHILHSGYLVQDRPGRRMRRALGLHALLAQEGGILFVTDLVGQYRSIFPNDLCSGRDALIMMERLRHLFLEVSEGFWIAMGPGGTLPDPVPVDGGVAEVEVEVAEDLEGEDLAEAGASDEGQTIAQAIEQELRRSGPARISDIIDRADDFLPAGRSRNSVGPVLLSSKDRFVRALPGVYALPDQVPSADIVQSAPPSFIFELDHIRTYVLARRADEPWGAFPLWIPEVEHQWCIWARQHAPPELLESLLAVADIEAWPEIEEKDAWRTFAEARGQFSRTLLYPPDSFVLPDLDRLFAACCHLRDTGHISWISANRVLFRRVVDHSSAGMLGGLIALGAVNGDSPDWQAPHLPGDQLNALTECLETARLREGGLNWAGGFGRTLREQAAQRPLVGSGWLTAEAASLLMGSDLSTELVETVALDPLEQLLAERAATISADALQATFRGLSANARTTDV